MGKRFRLILLVMNASGAAAFATAIAVPVPGRSLQKNRMSNPYRELFAVPGARDFASAGLLARLPLPMAATVMTTLPLLLVDSIAALVGTVLVAGLCFAPIMIVAMSLVERLMVVVDELYLPGRTQALQPLRLEGAPVGDDLLGRQ